MLDMLVKDVQVIYYMLLLVVGYYINNWLYIEELICF